MSIGHNGGPEFDWRDYGGFIVEARDTRDHPIVGYGKQVPAAEPDRGFCYSINEAWRDLLHECRFRDGYVMNGGHKMLVERGSLVGAVSWLAHRWNWTPKTVRGFLDRIENDGMIERVRPGSETGKQKGKQSTIIKVCNYSKFNPDIDEEGQAKWQAEGKQGASKGQAEGNNIRKNNVTTEQGNNEREVTPLPPEPEPSAPAERPRVGEEHVGSGVFVNCETVRHKDFSISLKGIELQLNGTVPMDEIKAIAVGQALQWALDIENGKAVHRVVPSNTANFIRGSIQNQRNHQAVTDVRKQRAAKPAAKSTGLNWCSAEGIEEAMREIQKSEGKR